MVKKLRSHMLHSAAKKNIYIYAAERVKVLKRARIQGVGGVSFHQKGKLKDKALLRIHRMIQLNKGFNLKDKMTPNVRLMITSKT